MIPPHLPLLLVITALFASSGCYVTHSSGGPERDATVDEGGTPDEGFDADVVPDSGFDADRPDRPDSALMDSSFDSTRVDSTRVDSGGPPDTGTPGDSGALDSAPPIDSGRPSRALSFGRGDRVLIAPSVALDMTTSHSYELWVRPRADGLVLHKGDVRLGERYQYLIEIRGGTVLVGWSTEDGEVHHAAPIAMDTWSHVAVVINANVRTATLTLYVNGVLYAPRRYRNTLVNALNDQPLLMGAGFVGDIDEVRIFTYARRMAEILSTMNARLSPVPPGMEAYWPLEERGQIVIDRTLRGNEGVLGNRTFPDDADPTWILDGPI